MKISHIALAAILPLSGCMAGASAIALNQANGTLGMAASYPTDSGIPVDWESAGREAAGICISWGYASAEPTGRETDRELGGGQSEATREYRCTR